MYYCQNCGSPCEDVDLFCKVCGTPLKTPSPHVQYGHEPASPGGPGMRPYSENFSAAGPQPSGNVPNLGGPAPGNGYDANPGYGYPNAGDTSGGYNGFSNPYAPQPRAYAYYPKNNGLATASMVLGIVGLVLLACDGLGIISSILAIIFSFVSKSAIKRSNGTEIGKGMATAGLVLGIVSVAIVLLAIVGIVILVRSGFFNGGTYSGLPSGQTYNT